MSLTDSLEQFKGLPLKWPHSTLTSPGRVLCSLSTAVAQSTAWEKKKKGIFHPGWVCDYRISKANEDR